MSSALPPISQSLIPANVRAEGAKADNLYETALSFEGMLDQQLTQALTDTLDPSASGDDSGGDSSDDSSDGSTPDAATSLMLQMLPQELSQALVSQGGLGLAPQLYQALGGTTAPPTGASADPTSDARTAGGGAK
jgi:Rod binding domain-containing protein